MAYYDSDGLNGGGGDRAPMITIEFNDRALTVGNGDGDILMRSPGFALVTEGGGFGLGFGRDKGGARLLVGEEAQRKWRLHPTAGFNRFWSELSLQPAPQAQSGRDGGGDAPPFRHYADLAYAHLQHVAHVTGVEGSVLFAVPGSFSREQLAVLLGVARRTPLRPVGLVDSALAAVVDTWPIASKWCEDEQLRVLYVDLHLHQALLSLLVPAEGRLGLQQTLQVPAAGSEDVLERLMRLAVDEFIAQSRFDPRHNAKSEQQLYDQLNGWLQTETHDLVLEIKASGRLHTAILSADGMLQALQPVYDKIHDCIDAVTESAGGEVRVMLSPVMSTLPGWARSGRGGSGRGNGAELLQSAALSSNCEALAAHIISGAQSPRLVRELPLGIGGDRLRRQRHGP